MPVQDLTAVGMNRLGPTDHMLVGLFHDFMAVTH